MTADSATVYVIDDDESVREAIGALLRSAGLRTQSFASAAEFLAWTPHAGPACLVLDVRLPGLSGLDLQQALGSAGVNIPIIFITGYGDIPMSVKAMKAGAVEFLVKPFAEQELLDAVRRALEGDRTEHLRRAELEQLRARFDSLTPRERQVLRLVVSGMLNKQIAGELGSSEITVKVHRRQVMQKMSAQSLADLVRMAGRLGLETPP
jgi:FixJ family two-component response regulator